MQAFLIILFKSVALQIVGVFGIFFVFSIILDFLQTRTQTIYRRSVGWKGILWTAWIGTPIHELSHAFFAKVFRHKIDKIDLFHPNEATGNLGSVNHSYNPNSLYQKIGNFFIGAAPLIAGPCVIILLIYLLLPNANDILFPFGGKITNFSEAISTFKNIFSYLFSPSNIRLWNFWLFIYLAFAIVIHMAPSKQDQKNLWRGFFWIVLVLIIINAFTLFLGVDVTAYILKVNKYLTFLSAFFVFSIILSLIHFLIAWIALKPFRRQ